MVSEDVYGSLRLWYLARLRREMRKASDLLKLTPLAQIEADKAQMERLVTAAAAANESAAPVTADGKSATPPLKMRLVSFLCTWVATGISATAVVALVSGGTEPFSLQALATTLVQLLTFSANQTTSYTPSSFAASVSLFLLPLGLQPYFFQTRAAIMGEGGLVAQMVPILVGCSAALMATGLWFLWQGSHIADIGLASSCLLYSGMVLSISHLLLSRSVYVNEIRIELAANSAHEGDVERAEVALDRLISFARSNRELRERERATADFAPMLLLAFTPDLEIICANKTSLSFLGVLPETLERKKLSDIVFEPGPEELSSAVLAIAAEGQLDARCRHSNGNLIDLRLHIERSVRENVYFTAAEDVSAEKSVARARSQYLAMLSHDIGTPVTSAMFNVVALGEDLDELSPEERRSLCANVQDNLQSVTDLLRELIDLERVTEGSLILQKENLRCVDLVGAAISQVSGLATRCGVEVQSECPSSVLYGDKQRLLRVLVNLISNAVRHSSSAPVQVVVEPSSKYIMFKVIDSGPGIAPQSKALIFDRYYRSPDNETGVGYGLGLAVCRAFVLAHDGLIGVDSELGGGSTFWFTVPNASDAESSL